MFLNKRELIILGILIYFSFSVLQAQTSYNKDNHDVLLKYKVLLLDGTFTYLPIYKKHQPSLAVTSNVVEISSDLQDIAQVYENNWSNTIFNVYWKKTSIPPFVLFFKDTVFSSPVEHKMVVTSRYGWRNGRAHQGIDIDLQTGDNVKTLLKGKVRYARRHGGHGKTIIVRHDNGLETVYAHLSKYLVKENDIVEKGQIIGKGGVSGNARGSHLHLEVRFKGKSIHPEYLFDFTQETKVRSSEIAVIKKWMKPRLHKSTRKSDIVIQTTLENIDINDQPAKSIYVVKRGDTLHGIARKHHINVSEICKINEIGYNAVLNIGQEILIY